MVQGASGSAELALTRGMELWLYAIGDSVSLVTS